MVTSEAEAKDSDSKRKSANITEFDIVLIWSVDESRYPNPHDILRMYLES
jgi:hypothetical protein